MDPGWPGACCDLLPMPSKYWDNGSEKQSVAESTHFEQVRWLVSKSAYPASLTKPGFYSQVL